MVDHLPIAAIVDLVNEYADPTRRVAGEADEPYPTLESLVPLGAERSTLVAVANDLHAVFADPEHAAEQLNALLDRHGLRHRMTDHGGLTWMRPESTDRAVAAAVAGLVDVVAETGPDRLGICDAHRCVDVYVDTSHATTRAYCSPQCRTRARVARWRAARRHAASVATHKETP